MPHSEPGKPARATVRARALHTNPVSPRLPGCAAAAWLSLTRTLIQLFCRNQPFLFPPRREAFHRPPAASSQAVPAGRKCLTTPRCPLVLQAALAKLLLLFLLFCFCVFLQAALAFFAFVKGAILTPRPQLLPGCHRSEQHESISHLGSARTSMAQTQH